MEAWTMEPDDGGALPQSWNGSPSVRPAEKMYQMSASDDRNLLLQQAAMAQRGLRPQTSGDFWNLSPDDKTGGKKKKKKDKKAKSAIDVTSPPWLQNGGIFQFNHTSTLNCQVEHLGTIKVDQSDVQRNPYNSIKRVKDLVTRGEGWVRDVVLMVTDSEVIMKEDGTQENLKRFPMAQIQMCKYLDDEEGGILMICVQSGDAYNPDIHVFQCTMTPAKMICEEINEGIKQYYVRSQDRRKNKVPGYFGERRFNAAPPIQLSEADRWQLSEADRWQLVEQQLRNHGIIDTEERHNENDDYDENSDAKLRYARSIMSRPQTSSTAGLEMKRTLKAAKIQRDVDILNHLMDDLEDFIASVRERAAAWQELEKKKKKSKKRKGDAALELLMMKAQPPAEQDYVMVYQKCKYAINLVSKLGHHLSSPSASELLQGLFGLLGELIRSNNGTQLAASVDAPLITKRAIHLMLTSLSKKNSILWRQLGEYWMTTSDRWPANRGPVPVYLVRFADGCIPPNLHNASDCPSNFPTLDPIPSNKRGPDYSDAYDEDYQGGMDDEHLNNQSTLRINPAVIEAEASKVASSNRFANMFPPQQSTTRENTQSVSTSAVQFGSQQAGQKVAKVIMSFTATSGKELSISRGEFVQVLNNTRNWWLVKNNHGSCGFVPSNMLELLPKQARDASKQDEDSVMFHGKVVPDRPNQPPPPVPTVPASPPQPSEANNAGLSRRSQSSKLAPPSMSIQPLPPLQEDAEESGKTLKHSTSSENNMLRASMRRKDHPPLAPPPEFAPTPPPSAKQPSSVSSPQLTRHPSTSRTTMQPPPAPPIPPGHPFSSVPSPPPDAATGAPPPPPPPPPVAPPQQQSLSELIQQHKLKTKQQQEQTTATGGGGRKVSVQEQMQFDIAKELSHMKPLRKVSKQQLDIETEKSAPSMDEDLQERLQHRRQNPEKDSGNMGSVMLKFDAEPKDVKLWLISQGFANCVGKLGKLMGEELYNMERDELKRLCGINNSARIYSQLQRDYAKAEREAMADDESGYALRSNRRSRDPAPPSRAKKDVKVTGRQSRGSTRRHKSPSPSESDQSDDGKGKHRKKQKKESRKKSKDSKEEKEKQKRKKKSSENTKVKKKGHKRHDQSSNEDDDSDDHDKKKNKKNRKHHKRHHDSDTESSNDSSSDNDSSDSSSSSSSSNSDDEQNIPDKTASAGQWALGEGDMHRSVAETSEIIKNQQKTLQKQLQQMQQLQKQLNITSLPAEERLPLQEHLLKLQQLQLELQREPNNRQVQMNLLKQQQDLQQHLIIVQQNLITMAASQPSNHDDEPEGDGEESQDEPDEPPPPDPVLLQQQQHLQLQAQQLAIQQHQVRQLYAHLQANAQQQAAEHMRRAQQQAQVEAQIRMETQARMAAHQQLKAQQQARIAQLQSQIHTQQHMLHQQDMLGPAAGNMYTPMATGQFY